MKKKRGYRFFQIGFFVLLALLIGLVLDNYNYLLFKLLIADFYIDTEALDTVYADLLGPDNVRGYHRNFDEVVIASLTAQIRSVNNDRYTFLYKPGQYQLSRDVEKKDAESVAHRALTDELVYLRIPNISRYTKDYILQNKAELLAYDSIVIDLRGNYGGLLADAYRVSELFVDKDAIIGREIIRPEFLTRTIRSHTGKYFSFANIYILQDENTASAAESLILALRQNTDQVICIGGRTFGKGIGQVALPLLRDFAVRATVLRVAGPDAVSIHRVGIEPDVLYTGDDAIGFVTEWAQNKKE